jgi:hypothetical protein
MSALLKTSPRKASIVFKNITSARNRNKAIENLLKEEFGETYSTFWFGEQKPGGVGGLFKLIYNVDAKRNEIVHWYQYDEMIDTEGEISHDLILSNQTTRVDFWGKRSAREQTNIITTEELFEFRDKCRHVSALISIFHFVVNNFTSIFPQDTVSAWRQMLQSPVPYPPPSGLVLFPNSREHSSRHPPSPV